MEHGLDVCFGRFHRQVGLRSLIDLISRLNQLEFYLTDQLGPILISEGEAQLNLLQLKAHTRTVRDTLFLLCYCNREWKKKTFR